MYRILRENFDVVSSIDEAGISEVLVNSFDEVSGAEVKDCRYDNTLIVYLKSNAEESLQMEIISKIWAKVGFPKESSIFRIFDARGVQIFKLISEQDMSDFIDLTIVLARV